MLTERYEIVLPQQQQKMIVSGWGEAVLQNVIVEKIIYLNDGLRIPGYVAYPKDAVKKYPCVLWNRGGFGSKGALDEFNAVGILGEIASWGYCVYASMYRGSLIEEGHDEMGGADLSDILCLKEQAGFVNCSNTEKWGIEGWSRGGFMSLLVLQQCSDFTAAIITAAISDFNAYIKMSNSENSLIRKLDSESIALVSTRSPIHHIDRLPKNVHYLLTHGAKDTTVHASQTIHLAEKMLNEHFNLRMVLFENGDHFLRRQREELRQLRRYWLNTYLPNQ